ncbi:MAG: GDP-mannose 4,6-dehydratase [Candidatus Woesebacteria bacterium]|jgi:GDP-4-dehydro-6-deoxy-D-mannose reductase
MIKGTKKHETILITGGTGFAGSHLVEALLEKNYHKIHVTSFGKNTGYVQSLLKNGQIHQLDLSDQQAALELMRKIKPDYIYHLAAFSVVGTSFEKIREILNNNLNLQLNILEAVETVVPKSKNLVIGSALEYKTDTDSPKKLKETDPLGPADPYAVSKVLQDMLSFYYAKVRKLRIVIARPFNHIGERQALGFVIPDFARQIVRIEQGLEKVIKVGNLESIRDFTDVKDMVQAYILLMEKGKIGEIYNLGSSKGYSIKSMLDSLIALAQTRISIKIDQNKFRPLDVETVIADNSKIVQLGWQAKINIKITLSRVLDYWRKELS